MKVYVNEITGIADAFVSLQMSKRSWSREKETHIREVCAAINDRSGHRLEDDVLQSANIERTWVDEYSAWMKSLVKWGTSHITLLRFVDISVTVEGLHRAGQDDWDSHAKRFNNRIIRSSTRLATFDYEMSDWYAGKIISTDSALELLGLEVPAEIVKDGQTYVKSVNGYVRQDLADDKDVKRGLYMLSIPSNFIFKIDITEWGHVYKERRQGSGANPEVQALAEEIAEQVGGFQKEFDRELFLKFKN
jgi:hypothetical protein